MLAMLIDDDGLKKGLSQQITFITLKQILSIKQKKPTHPQFSMDNIKMDRIPTKITRKIHAVFTVKFCKYFL